MKYLKLFEELQDFYNYNPFGNDKSERGRTIAYYIVSKDEKWVMRNNIEKYTWQNETDKYIPLQRTDNRDYFPQISHYYHFKSEQEAKQFIIRASEANGRISVTGERRLKEIKEELSKSFGEVSEIEDGYNHKESGFNYKVNIKIDPNEWEVVSYTFGLLRNKSKNNLF